MGEINVLGISGSLRAESYNTALLRNAVEIVPHGVRLDYTADCANCRLMTKTRTNLAHPNL
jgi:NAD(P)H-dependent FMN reductase